MKINIRTIIIILTLGIFYFIIRRLGIIDILSDLERFKLFIEERGNFGYFIYILIYGIAAVFSLPAWIFTVTAGIVFGPLKGGILALIGATVGALSAFLVSRYLARDLIVKKFGDSKVFKKIESGVEKNGRDFLILTRLVPIFPYNLQNYAYGMTNIGTLEYTLISLITMMPVSFIYAYMAGDIAENGVTQRLFFNLLLAGIILFFISQIPKIFAKKKNIDISNMK
ncbi:putative membrane protein YdjX (TVP38/TMEM64 family) [Acetoanaerobium pronyense]|uniref:Membrane protein YdjX (TVP38/TMEM64 family) n=1 Tax=Acetoanaerobium pronyense TaxID=1482736 RepID=A0ABS4KG64_9FIRM|nr:TVP38/TMEM64 family protein [Acetoanaerobium pronyense]MBP2026762.1 putative membrane protein YdjX (TVP38/TMEM64 family) [Acetoanaerobium pronyense]